MKIEIRVMPKKGILDPQGKAVHRALEALGYTGLADVRIGKAIQIEIDGIRTPPDEAQIRDMCEKLLVNTVIEEYTYSILS